MILIYALGIVIILAIGCYLYADRTIKKKEKFNRLNGMLNEQDLNLETEKGKYFRWDEVIPHLGKVLMREKFKNHDCCPKCHLQSEHLVWIDFSTSPDSWDRLAGRGGPLSICPNCKIQVEFLCYRLS